MDTDCSSFKREVKPTKQIGDEAEDKAVDFLRTKGYQVLERNYRYKRSEIDIIAKHENVLHIVEVKYRKNNDFGHPESAVNSKKEEMISQGAIAYMEANNWLGFVQYDIVAITGKELVFFEDFM